MTFHQTFGNHRENYALGGSTITYLNTRILQSLGGPVVGFKSYGVRISDHFNLLLLIFFFMYMFVCNFLVSNLCINAYLRSALFAKVFIYAFLLGQIVL